MRRETAISRIKATRRCTLAQARAMGLDVSRGAYRGTCDDRLDRWYIDAPTGPIDHRGRGHATQADALAAIARDVLAELGVG